MHRTPSELASTNMGHVVQWINAYPDAKSYVCPGGKKKHPDIKYTQVRPLIIILHILAVL